MKLIGNTTIVVALMIALCPGIVVAEAPTPRGRCWSRDIAMRPINDPQMRVTIAGRVIAIDRGKRQQMEIGTQLRLKTDDGQEMSIYLGPSQYLRSQQIFLRVGDRLEVQGAKIMGVRPPNAIVANTIKKGSQMWKIREPNGKPNWAKWCR